MNTRAKWAAVFLLGGLWAGLVIWDLVTMPEPQHVALTYVTGQKSSREAGRGKAEAGLRIRMDLLESSRRQAEGAFGSPKNIFAPLTFEKPMEKGSFARRMPPPPPPKSEPPSLPPGPTPEELAAQAALSELEQFRYLGYLSRQGRDEVFLSRGKDLHIVRAGDTIEPRVLVKAVTPKDVILQETRSQVEKTILLTGENK